MQRPHPELRLKPNEIVPIVYLENGNAPTVCPIDSAAEIQFWCTESNNKQQTRHNTFWIAQNSSLIPTQNHSRLSMFIFSKLLPTPTAFYLKEASRSASGVLLLSVDCIPSSKHQNRRLSNAKYQLENIWCSGINAAHWKLRFLHQFEKTKWDVFNAASL